MRIQRRKNKIPRFFLIPLIDCLLLLLLLLIIASKVFAPIRAIPIYFEPAVTPAINYPFGRVFVNIDDPDESAEGGKMHIMVGSIPILSGEVKYDEMLSRLLKVPNERKNELLIRAGRKVHQEQIVRVLEIGLQAGFVKVGYGSFDFVTVQTRDLFPVRPIIKSTKVPPRIGPIQDTK